MNKQGLADVVNDKIGGTKVQSEVVVDSIFNAISSTLKKGEEVSVAGFGIFATKNRGARTARNPKTGEQVHVDAKRVAKFKPAKALKELIA